MNPPDSTPIGDLKNLGPASVRMFDSVDVFTAGDVRKLGLPLLLRILKGKGIDESDLWTGSRSEGNSLARTD